MIFVNFKTYAQGSGGEAIKLANLLSEVSNLSQVKLIPVVQALDLKEIVESVKLEVWVQSIDPVDPGAHTGAVLPEAVVEDGATGTFLNHSEKKIGDYSLLSEAINQSEEAGLKTLVFAASEEALRNIVGLKPTFVAYEPPELVGNPDTSVAKEKPEVIEKASEVAKAARLPLIVGAGIKTAEDVRTSLKLGAVGVAVSSGVVTSADPREKMVELIRGFEGF